MSLNCYYIQFWAIKKFRKRKVAIILYVTNFLLPYTSVLCNEYKKSNTARNYILLD